MRDLETALTCCPLCRGKVKPVDQVSSYVRCLKCKKPSALEAVRRPVEEMTTLYQTAMSVMDQGQIDKAIQLLSLFIDMIEAFLRATSSKGTESTPIRELYLAQEALRLCQGVCGTKYSADTHLTLRAGQREK